MHAHPKHEVRFFIRPQPGTHPSPIGLIKCYVIPDGTITPDTHKGGSVSTLTAMGRTFRKRKGAYEENALSGEGGAKVAVNQGEYAQQPCQARCSELVIAGSRSFFGADGNCSP
jgi:hypothetical protein